MQAWYFAAGVLAAVTGVVHSVLGERLVFRHLRQGSVVPTGDAPPLRSRHVRILWATWHLASVLAWALDRFLAGFDLYRFFWHPALLRLSLFVCLFGALALTVYR